MSSVEALLPPATRHARCGRREKHPRPAVVDAVLYVGPDWLFAAAVAGGLPAVAGGVLVLRAVGGAEGHDGDAGRAARAATRRRRPRPGADRGAGRLPVGQGCRHRRAGQRSSSATPSTTPPGLRRSTPPSPVLPRALRAGPAGVNPEHESPNPLRKPAACPTGLRPRGRSRLSRVPQPRRHHAAQAEVPTRSGPPPRPAPRTHTTR